MRPFILSAVLAALLAGCTLLVEDPNAISAPLQPPAGAAPPSATTPAHPANAPADDVVPSAPPLPILLRRLPSLEEPDGAWVVTRGTILDDVAAFAGGKPLIHDSVLDERGGSLRLEATPEVLAAVRAGPRLVTGTLQRSGGRLRMRVVSVSAVPERSMSNLTVDDRPREPGERLTLTPGLHRLSLDTMGVASVEFTADYDDGPLTVLGMDGDGADGFSVTWSVLPDQSLTIRTTGFTVFGESVTGPTLPLLVGPTG